MGIDSGNNAEKAIAMELKHLNKKLDRLIDILLKSIPNHLVVEGLPKPEKEDGEGIPDPEWHAAADRYISYSTNGPGRSEES